MVNRGVPGHGYQLGHHILSDIGCERTVGRKVDVMALCVAERAVAQAHAVYGSSRNDPHQSFDTITRAGFGSHRHVA